MRVTLAHGLRSLPPARIELDPIADGLRAIVPSLRWGEDLVLTLFRSLIDGLKCFSMLEPMNFLHVLNQNAMLPNLDLWSCLR